MFPKMRRCYLWNVVWKLDNAAAEELKRKPCRWNAGLGDFFLLVTLMLIPFYIIIRQRDELVIINISIGLTKRIKSGLRFVSH